SRRRFRRPRYGACSRRALASSLGRAVEARSGCRRHGHARACSGRETCERHPGGFFMSVFPVIVVIVLIILLSSIKILREYERGVVFLFGRFQAVKGPGIIILIPIMQQMVRMDLRTIVVEVPPQDVISRDNVPVKVNAMILYRVIDPEKAVIQVEDAREATSQLAQTTLRSVLGRHELDE